MNTKIDFLYLSQDDVVKAGVTDMHHCIDTMEEMFGLLGQGDYLMGDVNHNSHGIEIVPPLTSPFPQHACRRSRPPLHGHARIHRRPLQHGWLQVVRLES